MNLVVDLRLVLYVANIVVIMIYIVVSHVSVANSGEELISCVLTFYCKDQSLF